MTETIKNLILLISHTLPDDVEARLKEMREAETDERARMIYDTMFKNEVLAAEKNCPACQDTGILQFFVRSGTAFPLLNELNDILGEATRLATIEAPLRPNAVEVFREHNTGTGIGKGIPNLFFEPVPEKDHCELTVYMAGGGCTLPGFARVLMPGEGLVGIVRDVLEQVKTYGVNACPPLVLGVGIAANMESAALLSKKALLRPLNEINEDKDAAEMEHLIKEKVNEMQIGPQGLGGKETVIGVRVEVQDRHPATLAFALSVGCWQHRRGSIVFDREGNYRVTSHEGVKLS